MFHSKIHNFFILKLFTGCIEWAFMYPHVKYQSDQVILKFLHKLTYNY